MTPFIVVFLLLFAILAFAWFYLQRAKTRSAGEDQPGSTTADSIDQPR